MNLTLCTSLFPCNDKNLEQLRNRAVDKVLIVEEVTKLLNCPTEKPPNRRKRLS